MQLGFNAYGRHNVVWHAATGRFLYGSGCYVVGEDLETHAQQFVGRHEGPVSTIALQHDGVNIAAAAGGNAVWPC